MHLLVPARLENDPAGFLKDRLFLIDETSIAIQFLRRFLLWGAKQKPRLSFYHKKDGDPLPAEMEDHILREVQSSSYSVYSFFKATLVSTTPSNIPSLQNCLAYTLHCVRHEFDLNQPDGNRRLLARNIDHPSSMRTLRSFINYGATPEEAMRINVTLARARDLESRGLVEELLGLDMTGIDCKPGDAYYESTFEIPPLSEMLECSEFEIILDWNTRDIEKLYWDITIPDIIEYIDKGRCNLCHGGKVFENLDYNKEEYWRLTPFIDREQQSAFTDSLACPLCNDDRVNYEH
ncbi:hypothetical protein QBC43DRAFT_329557 [Cladorrhinum sp. PSN259]|nr:hypothetical protein QBC43DRAFT_329557 [Cladorrhinum sp. PSN259]